MERSYTSTTSYLAARAEVRRTPTLRSATSTVISNSIARELAMHSGSLEPCEGKLSRTVLRGGSGSDAAPLPDYNNPEPDVHIASFQEFLALFTVLPLTEDTMRHFARLRALLRKQGNLIPDLDLLIAATALEHELVLLTRHRVRAI